MDKLHINTKNYLELNFIDNQTRPIVLVAPGGAYFYTSKREAAPVCEVFQKAGYHTGIIYYREELLLYPKTTEELSDFVKQVRKDARVAKNKVYLLGFSAGGHYVASLGVDFQKYGQETRPDALILSYPVITGKAGFAHVGSVKNLFGDINDKIREDFSLEERVNAATPSTFLFHTVSDDAVPFFNSLLFFEALNKNKVKAELHLYQDGPHGLALANRNTPYENMDPLEYEKKFHHLSSWVGLAITWLKKKSDQI